MSLSHRRLSAWYRQLAQQLEAGLPFAVALRSSRGAGAPAAGLEAMARRIETGGSIDDALRHAGTWLPLADILVLSAAADAGRMPHTLRNLSARHAQIGATKLRIILACLYPVAVLHAGLLLLPVARMIDLEKGFQWSASAYLRGVAPGLFTLWGRAFCSGGWPGDKARCPAAWRAPCLRCAVMCAPRRSPIFLSRWPTFSKPACPLRERGRPPARSHARLNSRRLRLSPSKSPNHNPRYAPCGCGALASPAGGSAFVCTSRYPSPCTPTIH